MSIQKPFRITKGNNSYSIGPSPYFFISSICLVHMKVFAKFDEIPSMTLQDIKETKRYGHTFVRSFVCSDGRTDNVKTVYPPTNKVCGGYN